MDKNQRQALEQAEAVVERARRTHSKQPRFKGDGDSNRFFGEVLRWLKTAALDCPDYSVDSRERDAWLRENWQREPHWMGVLNTVLLVDSSRGWTLTGGRNQVYRYTNLLHGANDGRGWRQYIRQQALSYRVTDIGAITELGRDGRNGPLRGLYHTDSARCRWTGKIKLPMEYSPSGKHTQEWRPADFFNVCSMPSDNETFQGLGFCATSRAMELIKLLYGVLMHDQEQVGARMPKGLLMLRNISETQWESAMRARDAALNARDRLYYGGVMVLAGTGAEEPDAKLVALSQLPANFNQEKFMDQTMAGYALVNGYDAREFWPMSTGSLGTGSETEAQHAKASTKGVLEFPHAYQEKLQQELPDSLEFAFEERDEAGQLLQAQVMLAFAEGVQMLYKSDPATGQGLIDREEGRTLLVDQGVIPPEWTEYEEEAQATDEEAARMRRLRNHAKSAGFVVRAALEFPADPIIRYHWPSGREMVLWERGADALRRQSWPVAVVRQAGDEGEVLYAKGDVVITEGDVERAIEEGGQRLGEEFAAILEAGPMEEERGLLARLFKRRGSSGQDTTKN